MNEQMEVPAYHAIDPALVMGRLWQADYDELNQLCTDASSRERVMFDAAGTDKADAERAFVAARDARDKLMDKLEETARALSKQPAHTLRGISAKLAVAILQNAPVPTSEEPPWPMLRSCVDDLERLAANQNEKTSG